MSIPNLKAIKDWCIGKFQPKGEYLTSVPEEYVTDTELQETITDTKLQKIILDYNEGVRLGKDAEGRAGYYQHDESTGADTVVPFSGSEVAVNGEVRTFTVADNNTIEEGDFIQLQYESNYKHMFPNNTNKSCVKIPATNKYIIAYQLADNGAYGVGLFEFKNNTLELVSEIITTTVTKLNTLLLFDESHVILSGSQSSSNSSYEIGIIISIDTNNNTLSITYGTIDPHNYITVLKNKICIVRYSSTDSVGGTHYLALYDLTDGSFVVFKPNKKLSVGGYNFITKGYVTVNDNTIAIAYEYTRSSSSTGMKYREMQSIVLSEDYIFAFDKKSIIREDYSNYFISSITQITENYFMTIERDGAGNQYPYEIKAYDNNLLNIATINKPNTICNVLIYCILNHCYLPIN